MEEPQRSDLPERTVRGHVLEPGGQIGDRQQDTQSLLHQEEPGASSATRLFQCGASEELLALTLAGSRVTAYVVIHSSTANLRFLECVIVFVNVKYIPRVV